MPPKPQVFKTPDGKEFSSKSEWRDYMVTTFFSFKNKVDEAEPLMKNPGDIDGNNRHENISMIFETSGIFKLDQAKCLILRTAPTPH